MYNVILAQINFLLLFWTTYQIGAGGVPFLQTLVAIMMQTIVTLVVQQSCSLAFKLCARRDMVIRDLLDAAGDEHDVDIEDRKKTQAWTLIFRQTAPRKWVGPGTVRLGAWDPDGKLFAALDKRSLEHFRDEDGSFTFRMCAVSHAQLPVYP